MQNSNIWVLGDDRKGLQVQYTALAESLSSHFIIKHFSFPFPWNKLPPLLNLFPLSVVSPKFTPPWPDIVISMSRQSTALALAIKKASGGKSFLIHIQKPHHGAAMFDVVVAPQHDGLSGDNVISTMGSLHALSPKKLAEEAAAFHGLYPALGKPLIGVLLGGNRKKVLLRERDGWRLSDHLKKMQDQLGGTLFIVPSRRTPAFVLPMLKVALEGREAQFWIGDGPNPYRGLLGAGDVLVTTCDSINMMTEIAATGKPGFVFHYGEPVQKFKSFYRVLDELNLVKSMEQDFALWTPTPIFELSRVVDEIKKRYEAYKGRGRWSNR